MITLNLQYFGGRGSAAGKRTGESSSAAESIGTGSSVTTQRAPEEKPKSQRISRNYQNRNDKIETLRNGQTVTFNASNSPADPFKSNGLGDVVYNMSLALNKGDRIEITSDHGDTRGYKSTILITAEYENGNRGYTVIYPEYTKPERIQQYLNNGTTRRWRDITEGAAWLDFNDKYKLKVKKAK